MNTQDTTDPINYPAILQDLLNTMQGLLYIGLPTSVVKILDNKITETKRKIESKWHT